MIDFLNLVELLRANAYDLPRFEVTVVQQVGQTAFAFAGAYNEAERCALEALAIATKARLVPLALEALVTLAAVRIQNGEKEAAHALLLFFILNLALQHSASTYITKERARDLLTELEPYLTPALMPDHSSHMPQFEEIVAKVLKGP